MVSLLVIALVILTRNISKQVKSREDFNNTLKSEYYDFELDDTKNISYPEITFSDNNFKFRIFSKLKKRRKYINIYDEYLELENKNSYDLTLMKKKIQEFLFCDVQEKNGNIFAKISELKD